VHQNDMPIRQFRSCKCENERREVRNMEVELDECVKRVDYSILLLIDNFINWIYLIAILARLLSMIKQINSYNYSLTMVPETTNTADSYPVKSAMNSSNSFVVLSSFNE